MFILTEFISYPKNKKQNKKQTNKQTKKQTKRFHSHISHHSIYYGQVCMFVTTADSRFSIVRLFQILMNVHHNRVLMVVNA